MREQQVRSIWKHRGNRGRAGEGTRKHRGDKMNK